MTAHSKITATSEAGTITVTAGKGLRRCYSWDGATRCLEMHPRTQRWNGSLGIYNPGDGYPWKEHQGIARAVVEEGQQHFQTTEEATAWIAKQKAWLPLVYRRDGLLVGWRKTPERKQLNVEVWQLLIAGTKPAALPGASDASIVIGP